MSSLAKVVGRGPEAATSHDKLSLFDRLKIRQPPHRSSTVADNAWFSDTAGRSACALTPFRPSAIGAAVTTHDPQESTGSEGQGRRPPRRPRWRRQAPRCLIRGSHTTPGRVSTAPSKRRTPAASLTDREQVLHGPALAHPHPIESSLYVKRRFGRWVKRRPGRVTALAHKMPPVDRLPAQRRPHTCRARHVTDDDVNEIARRLRRRHPHGMVPRANTARRRQTPTRGSALPKPSSERLVRWRGLDQRS